MTILSMAYPSGERCSGSSLMASSYTNRHMPFAKSHLSTILSFTPFGRFFHSKTETARSYRRHM